MSDGLRVIVCGAGAVGACTAYYLAQRGARPLVVDRVRPAAAASGRAAGFLALDWNVGTPLDELARRSFALHRGLAAELGEERVGYRPMDALMTAAADEGDLERYRRLPNPGWLDGNVVAHEAIGDHDTTAQINPRMFTTGMFEAALDQGARFTRGVVDGLEFDGPDGALSAVSVDGAREPADVVVLALGPWTAQAQRWLALPQVFGSRSASVVLDAEVPAQAVFSEYIGAGGQRQTIEIYPRADGTVYVSGRPDPAPLPDDPEQIAPTGEACDDLHRIAGVHSSALGAAEAVARTACFRPLTVDGVPLIGPVPGAPGAYLATGHASWGILLSPATGRMVAEMIMDGRSRSVDAAPFALERLPAGRIA